MSILIVDDSNTVLHVVGKILNELGYTHIKKANSYNEARMLLEGIDIPPDVIISDWNMKEGTGLDLLRYVRGNRKIAAKPFILLTSDHDRNKIKQAREYSPQFYLLKPCSKKILAEKLSILSKTHGVPPPEGYEFPESASDTLSESAEELSTDSALSVDPPEFDSAKVLKQIVFYLTKRKTPEEFRTFLENELFHKPMDKVSLTKLMEVIDKLHTTIEHSFRSVLEIKPHGK